MQDDIMAFDGAPIEKAKVLLGLSAAYWMTASDPFHLAESVRLVREALTMDSVTGRAHKALGMRLVTLGYFDHGVSVLRQWFSKRNKWTEATENDVCDVQYTIGYAARYQAHYAEAEMWYKAAMEGYSNIGDEKWFHHCACALGQVMARMGRIAEAREVMRLVPLDAEYEGYRLKAMVEILYAEGDTEAALMIGDDASEALAGTEDPWELAELHTLLASLQYQAGNYDERDRHMEVVELALRSSQRHDLYTQARLLLDLDGKEVEAV